ncbi:MAG: DNA polymerase III subunit beta [Bacteroidales bacterium]
MNFIVSSIQLLKSLQSISGVLNSSNTLPILDDFLFELKDESLTITASDLETTVTVNVQLSRAEEPGAITIPAKILLEILKTFPDVPLQFSIDTEVQTIEISTGEGKYKLAGHNADEYPRTPVMEDIVTLMVPAPVIATAISKTLFATGNDEFRQVMTGVFCQISPEDMIFVATDAHKLVRYRRLDHKAENAASFILPKKPLNQLKGLLSHQEDEVTIEYNQTNASFSFGNIHLICRLIDGRYPNYEAVIPKVNPNKLTIERVPFLNSLRRVAIFANQSTHQIRLKISGQELVLSAEDIDYANEAKERLNCNYEGEDMEIGFNSKFLVEMVTNLDTDEIRLEMSEPNRAGILVPMNNENSQEDILMLVMPVMLAQY